MFSLVELHTQHPALLTDAMQEWESWMLLMQEMPSLPCRQPLTLGRNSLWVSI